MNVNSIQKLMQIREG
jgi:hypothetical protein